MIDSITISRETLQTVLDLINPLHGSLDRQTYQERLEQNFDAPSDAEYAVDITAQQERDLTQAVLILEDRLSQARASPPSSAMREALENIIDMTENCAGVPTDPSSLPQMVLHVARAALSADDGWVIVDEEHPLPDDLREGDWIRASLVRLTDVEGRIGKTDHSDKIQYRYLCDDEWLPDEAITAYRRAQKPSHEQQA